MNTPADDGKTICATPNYVLGVLDADARAAVAHEVATTSEAAVAVGAVATSADAAGRFDR